MDQSRAGDERTGGIDVGPWIGGERSDAAAHLDVSAQEAGLEIRVAVAGTCHLRALSKRGISLVE